MVTNALRETAMAKLNYASRAGRARAGILTVLALALAGCDVTNPGPVQDEFLNLPDAHQALVNGAGARLVQAISYIGMQGAFSAREVFPTGNCCGNPNQTPLQQAGRHTPEQAGVFWQLGHQARWIAEDALKRFTALGQGKVQPTIMAEAYLTAGYANRVLGENMCDAVFDGGAKQPIGKHFERAQEQFTQAINLGTGNVKTAAYAGRASVRLYLKDWAGAASDAQLVPVAFTYTYVTDTSNQQTQNNIWFNNANSPYRSYSSFKTWQLDYYNQTGDPRVQIGVNAAIPYGNATLTGYGQVPWAFQQKYATANAPFKVSSGREMALVRAEAALNANDVAGAMTLINSIRTILISRTTNQPLPALTATTAAQAWTFLKRERGIELWLEARRLGDMKRWKESNAPGTLEWPNWEGLVRPDGQPGGSLFKENPPSTCFPIPLEELETNSNLS
ncbi:MAG: RagB/SusD family nutrient uptake outer membrane protein [Gemmatimonadetes bacterium]|nr:RagB/SusD family nutrient uptake outer membrane protein [Gemmatimonadota bacterium]